MKKEKTTRQQRLDEAVLHLISVGLIDGKSAAKSIAITMDRNYSNISAAMRGEPRYLNPKFIRDFCATYRSIISANWILQGKGEMLNKNPSGITTHLTSHVGRHTFATTIALKNKMPIEVLQKVMGHESVKTTQIYAKVLQESVDEEFDKLDEIIQNL